MEIIWDEKAADKLSKFEILTARRILSKVEQLSEETASLDIKRLSGLKSYRLRVGDYRVIFEINDNIIYISNVGHRKNIYTK